MVCVTKWFLIRISSSASLAAVVRADRYATSRPCLESRVGFVTTRPLLRASRYCRSAHNKCHCFIPAWQVCHTKRCPLDLLGLLMTLLSLWAARACIPFHSFIAVLYILSLPCCAANSPAGIQLTTPCSALASRPFWLTWPALSACHSSSHTSSQIQLSHCAECCVHGGDLGITEGYVFPAPPFTRYSVIGLQTLSSPGAPCSGGWHCALPACACAALQPQCSPPALLHQPPGLPHAPLLAGCLGPTHQPPATAQQLLHINP